MPHHFEFKKRNYMHTIQAAADVVGNAGETWAPEHVIKILHKQCYKKAASRMVAVTYPQGSRSKLR